MPGSKLVVNFVAFQAVWFAMILAVASQRPILCWPLAAAALALHLALSRRRLCDARFVAACAILGWSIDLALTGAGVFNAGPWPPIWLLAFWLNFGTLPRVSLGWLAGRPILAALLGAIGGPLAYGSAARLGAIALPSPPDRSIMILAAAWMFLTPISVWMGGLKLSGSSKPAA